MLLTVTAHYTRHLVPGFCCVASARKTCQVERRILESDSKAESSESAKRFIRDRAKKKRKCRQESHQAREGGRWHCSGSSWSCSRSRDSPGDHGYFQKSRKDSPSHHESRESLEGQGKTSAPKVQTALESAASSDYCPSPRKSFLICRTSPSPWQRAFRHIPHGIQEQPDSASC
jgi:hypothetical protein